TCPRSVRSTTSWLGAGLRSPNRSGSGGGGHWTSTWRSRTAISSASRRLELKFPLLDGPTPSRADPHTPGHPLRPTARLPGLRGLGGFLDAVPDRPPQRPRQARRLTGLFVPFRAPFPCPG